MALDADRIEAVVFDLDDTLIDWSGTERRAVQAIIDAHVVPAGVPSEEAWHIHRRVLEESFRDFQATGQWWYARDRIRRFCVLAGKGALDPDAMERTFRAAVADTPFLPGAEATLDAVCAAGHRIGMLTNGPVPFQRDKVDRLGLSERFHFIGISAELGLWKPDPAAFHHVLDRIGAAPEQALMVGDSLYFDIAPAKALGMQTAWIQADATLPGIPTHTGIRPPRPGMVADAVLAADVMLSGPADLARLFA